MNEVGEMIKYYEVKVYILFIINKGDFWGLGFFFKEVKIKVNNILILECEVYVIFFVFFSWYKDG